MAISKTGHLGSSSGKIGNVVFYMLNGQQVSRTIGRPKKPTKAQLANQQAMAVTMKLLKLMLNFIKPGFELKAKGTTRNSFNLAVSYNKKHALKGAYPKLNVDYSKVLLSSGTLASTERAEITKVKEGVLLNWTADHPDRYAYGDDLVMVVLHFPTYESSRSYLNAARRTDGTCFIPVYDEKLLNGPIEAYMCFKSANGERISDSIYLGNLNGSAEEEQETERMVKEKLEYKALNDHFEKVKAVYLKFKNNGTEKSRKAFKSVKQEYEVFSARLQQHPGKPG